MYEELKSQAATFITPYLIDYRWWIVIGCGLTAMLVSNVLSDRAWTKELGRKRQWDDDLEGLPDFDKRVSSVSGVLFVVYGIWLLDHGRSTVGVVALMGGAMALQNWLEAHTQEERDKLGVENFIHTGIAMVGGYFAQKFLAGPSYWEKVPASLLGYYVTFGLARLSDVGFVTDVVLTRIEWRKHRAEVRKAFALNETKEQFEHLNSVLESFNKGTDKDDTPEKV